MKNKNNTMYILMGNGGWESDDVLGIYDSKDKAREAAAKYALAVKADIENETYDLREYVDGYYIMEKIVNEDANDDNVLRASDNCQAVVFEA
jgi:hypothetical protein